MDDNELDPVAVAKELVIPTQAKPADPPAKPLDSYVQLLGDYVECQRSIDFWEKRLEKLKVQLAEIMGEAEVGTVNGEAVFFYATQNRFRTKDFAKQYPDFYRLYSREFTEKRFDPEWLRLQRPDLYEQFQVRAMRNTFDA